jgi:hypothetical protein
MVQFSMQNGLLNFLIVFTEIIFQGTNGKHQNEILCNFFIALATQIESYDQTQNIKNSFSNFVKGNDNETGVLTKQLNAFLVDIVGEDSKLCKILKCCHQGIIAPLIIELKLSICPKLPFKDATGGGWIIDIVLFPNSVIVTHTKKQQHIQVDNKKEVFILKDY